jgi:hypothetical protein
MRRFRYSPEIVLIALWLFAALIFFGVIWPARSQAADWATCATLSKNVRDMVHASIGDDDIMQYVADRSFSHCLLLDEPPISIMFGEPQSDWALRCAMEYRSFRPSDGTVVRRGSHTRVRCPL